VYQTVLFQIIGDTGLLQGIDGDAFQHAGPNAAQNVVSRLTFKNDVVDTVSGQNLSQQQTGRARSDNSYLSSHFFLHQDVAVLLAVWRIVVKKSAGKYIEYVLAAMRFYANSTV
jgi:hypothetical protein